MKERQWPVAESDLRGDGFDESPRGRAMRNDFTTLQITTSNLPGE